MPDDEATSDGSTATGTDTLVELAARRRTVPDELDVTVPRGGRVLVCADLRMVPGGTDESREASRALARPLEEWRGPGVVVLAGEMFDLLRDGRADVDGALAAHPRLASALTSFLACDERRVVILPGVRDAALAYDARVIDAITANGWDVALSCLLQVDTGSGPRLVRIEPGHRLDPTAAFDDPRDRNDHPLAQHLEREVLPVLATSGDGSQHASWLQGVEDADPADMGSLVASRFAYRRLFRRATWLTLPVLAVLLLFFPVAVWSSRRMNSIGHVFRLLATGFAIELVIVVVALTFVIFQLRDALSSVSWWAREQRGNDAARGEGVAFVAAGGAGLVTAHTRRAELTDLGNGAFYANCGTAGRVVERAPTHAGLPSVYAARLRCSWVELEAGADLHARLANGVRDLPERTLLERIAMRGRIKPAWPPAVVAQHPGTVTWPAAGDRTALRRRNRRIAATAIAFAGVLNLASAVSLPIASRLRELGRLTPIVVPEAAAALVAVCGVGLLLLAFGVRRGQRHAWLLAIALLFVSVAGNVIKGLDVEEAVISLAIIVFLFLHHDDFAAPGNPSRARRAVFALLLVIAVAIIGGTIGVALRHPPQSLTEITWGITERLVGVRTIDFPNRIDRLVSPALIAVGIGCILAFFWLLFRPAVAPRGTSFRPLSRERVRFLVERYGADSLSYFALRDDKEWFGFRDTVVAYKVHNGVALVSPDPIGPVGQRAEAWTAFREFADEHGWPVAVMGACGDWLPVYRASGMHDLYVGDEAVVDVRRFSLEGKQNKSLRQSVGRVEKAGYRVEFFDPCNLDQKVRNELLELMTESRRGDVERGFSMTLGRAFEADDRGLLLAVAFDRDDHAVGFCQYVPAKAINGWSLDLMRRSESREVPNGLTEFIVTETIAHAREQGYVGIALNFATFRAVLASEAGDRLVHRAQKWFLERMSDSMQIESLWTFNEKFQPEWHPRYACYDSPEHLLGASIAVARAESFFELPVIGRFFTPKASDGREHPQPTQLPTPAGDQANGDQATGDQGCDGLGPSPSTSNAKSST
jgi:lysylphosphatidylglycerol synthetase-like protein (DUF2156 family)